jgi:hypothetical protein
MADGRRRKGAPITPRVSNRGYALVDYTQDDGRRVTRTVHTVLLEAFTGPRPPGMQACHFDDQPLHNCHENLRWDDDPANRIDRMRNSPAQPKAERKCILCGQVVHHGGRRCTDCVQDIAYQAARQLEDGATPAQVARHLNYPSVSGIVTLAVRYGGYRQLPPAQTSPLRRVTATLRGRSRRGDAA